VSRIRKLKSLGKYPEAVKKRPKKRRRGRLGDRTLAERERMKKQAKKFKALKKAGKAWGKEDSKGSFKSGMAKKAAEGG